ncbi:hypothetical protein [Anaerorhabdus furcosa]|uniref:Uncharacterized protein n=1 Tax=Anaerorhabdus furcosa TaxID=118967 RepID=A0A1T4MGY1_9FIRM|nr:hypothetical protein [Anaerorhabdus furcosa]SJZ66111.1 hypothetical protein SAMN02745191_1245 [Anaerorhabdus furcosa]
MKDTLMKYGVILSKRYSRRQKNVFLSEVVEELKAYDKPLEIKKKKDILSKGIHCIVGDISNADKVVIAAYDTPSKAYFFNVDYYPFHINKNIKSEKKILISQLSLSLLLSIPFLVYAFIFKNLSQLQILYLGFITIVMLLMAAKILYGNANKINMNRNSASVALLIELAKLKYETNTAFILVDNAVASFKGYREIDDFIKKDAKVMILDSLAYGEQLVCVHKKKINVDKIKNNKELDIYERIYENTDTNTILDSSKNVIYVGSGSLRDNQFVVKNIRTKEDYHVNVERLEKIKDVLVNYLEDKA